MADTRPTELTTLNEAPNASDFVEIVDVSDPSDNAAGSSKKVTITNLLASKADSTHSHTTSDISNFFTSVDGNTNVAANTAARHTHANQAVLDNITAAFTSADESKLDGIEASADVTDAANVNAAGATMNTDTNVSSNSWVLDEDTMSSDSNTKVPTQQSVKAYVDANVGGGGAVSSVNSQTGAVVLDPDDLNDSSTTNKFTTAADISKLAAIEASADVTDTANVTAAGALMDSEVDADIKTLSLPASTTISTFGASLIDDTSSSAARTTLGVDAAGTDNSTAVTLAGEDFLSLSGQEITANAIDLDNLSATGTASSSTFLRGDNTWATPAGGGGGGITWNEVTGTSQTAAVDNGYITNNASLVTVTLPTTAAVGETVRVAGKGAGGWRVAQNASEIIHFLGSDTTTGTGGRLDSTSQYDAVELVCTVANTEWVVISSMGNITIT